MFYPQNIILKNKLIRKEKTGRHWESLQSNDLRYKLEIREEIVYLDNKDTSKIEI